MRRVIYLIFVASEQQATSIPRRNKHKNTTKMRMLSNDFEFKMILLLCCCHTVASSASASASAADIFINEECDQKSNEVLIVSMCP